MEKKKQVNKKNIEIKVQFEYLNQNNVLDLSKEYKIKISLDENTDFEANKKKILKEAKFKTEKERENYHMFSKSRKKFLLQNSDFEPYIKTNTSVILINCYEYCSEVIKKINEDLNYLSNKSKNNTMNEIKTGEIINDLTCLENNLSVDVFADDFIYKKGTELLLHLIKAHCGDIRLYASKGIKKLLSFQNAIDFFIKNENNLNTLFNVFIGNNEISNEFALYDIIFGLIGVNQEIMVSLLNKCDDYFYKKMIKFLVEDKKNDDLKNYILLFIVTILNFVEKEKQNELIIKLTKYGIFEALDKILKNNEETLLENVELFESTLKKFLEENENKEIQQKYNKFVNNMNIYEIQNLIFKANSKDEEIKSEAINLLNNLLKENKQNFDIIYDLYIKNDDPTAINYYYNYFLYLFESDENNIDKFIDTAKNYAEKSNSKPLIKIMNILTDTKSHNSQLKIDTLSFINKTLITILNSTNDENYFELLLFLTNNGIFKFIEKVTPETDEKLSKECDQFKDILEKNFNKLEFNDEEQYQIIKNEYIGLKERKIIKEINELLLQVHNTNSQSHLIASKKIIDMIKDQNIFKIFFKMFVENEFKNLYFSFFEIFTMYCGGQDDLSIKFIKTADEYEKKNKINCYSIIINYLDEYQNELVQLKALKLVNVILSIKDKKYSYAVLNKFDKEGIFENLNGLVKVKENLQDLRVQLEVFFVLVEDILKENKKRENFDSLNKKLNNLKQNKDFFEKTMDEFIVLDEY